MSDPVIEAALAAWFDEYRTGEAEAVGGFMGVELNELRAAMARVVAVVEAAALEEAAAAAETRDLGDNSPQDVLAQEIASAIRALAGRPADPT
jgi:hypothetical protein